MKKFFAVAFATLVAVAAQAEGTLGYSLKNNEGFWRVDVAENESVREGVLSIFGSRFYLTSYEQDGRFYMPFAQHTNDNLEIKPYNEKHIWYRGFLYTNVLSTMDVYKNLEKGTMRIIGKLGDNLDFQYDTNINKKGKRTAHLYWFDKGDKNGVEMNLDITFSPDKAGSCTGILNAAFDEVARFACKSDGKLTDAFYKSEQDVIAWMIHLLITPEEANKKSIIKEIMKAKAQK